MNTARKNENALWLRQLVVLGLLVLANVVQAQEDIYVMEDIPEKSDFLGIRPKLKRNDLAEIESGFMLYDYNILEPHLHKKLRKDVKATLLQYKEVLGDKAMKVLTHYESNYFSTEVSTLLPHGEEITLRFNENVPGGGSELNIDYTYVIVDSVMIINSISLKCYADIQLKHSFPKELNSYTDIVLKLKSIDQWEVFEKSITDLKRLYKALQPYQLNYIKNELDSKDLSIYYGTLSYNLIFKHDFEKAIQAAKMGLQMNPTQTWIQTNLALAYLLHHEYDKAEPIYRQFRDKIFSGKKTFREAFIEDLNKAKASGLENADFAKIYQLLHQ